MHIRYTQRLRLGLAPLLALFAAFATLPMARAASESAISDQSESSHQPLPPRNAEQSLRSRKASEAGLGAMTERHRQALARQYLLQRSYRHSTQLTDQHQDYASNVGQGATNQGSAQGHQLDQQQGGVNVGSLVSQSGGGEAMRASGPSWQFSPQSNALQIEGDNYAPLSLSNIAANNGSVHIGDTYQGNMYGSQIGNNQYGTQQGATVTDQQNSQKQQADSDTESQTQTQGGGS